MCLAFVRRAKSAWDCIKEKMDFSYREGAGVGVDRGVVAGDAVGVGQVLDQRVDRRRCRERIERDRKGAAA